MILPGIIQNFGRMTRSIAVVVALAAMTLMSCSHDTPDLPAGEDQTGVVAFSVVAFKTAGSFVGSRATWSDEYDKDNGDEFDTRLLKDQLYVVITDESCDTKYAVTNLVCTGSNENGVTVVYHFTGRISDGDIDAVAALEKGKLHVIANAGYNPELYTYHRFSHYGQPDDKFNAIPMWGVKQINNLSAIKDPNKILDIEDVSLLRSMAKVVVELDNNTDDNFFSTLKSLTLPAINTDGYLLPDKWDEITETKTLTRTAINIPLQPKYGPVNFTFTNNRVEFYMPEIFNPEDEDELKLTLSFVTKDNVEGTGELLFRQYSGGEPTELRYDIRRNYLYHYKVRMEATELSAVVDVIPFSSVELEPDYGLYREPISGYSPIFVPGTTTIDHWQDKWGTEWYLGNTKGELYATINNEKCLFVSSYPNRVLSHWFDAKGNLHWIEDVNDITGGRYIPIYDRGELWPDWYLDSQNRKVWITPDRYPKIPNDGGWSKYKSQYVWDLTKYQQTKWGDKNYTPDYWYDFMGKRHEMDEDEETVLAEFIAFLNQ